MCRLPLLACLKCGHSPRLRPSQGQATAERRSHRPGACRSAATFPPLVFDPLICVTSPFLPSVPPRLRASACNAAFSSGNPHRRPVNPALSTFIQSQKEDSMARSEPILARPIELQSPRLPLSSCPSLTTASFPNTRNHEITHGGARAKTHGTTNKYTETHGKRKVHPPVQKWSGLTMKQFDPRRSSPDRSPKCWNSVPSVDSALGSDQAKAADWVRGILPALPMAGCAPDRHLPRFRLTPRHFTRPPRRGQQGSRQATCSLRNIGRKLCLEGAAMFVVIEMRALKYAACRRQWGLHTER